MSRFGLGIVLVGVTLVVASLQANAGARSFFAPSVLGDRIAFCTAGNEICGKPIADAWCSNNGFDKAILFQRDRSAKDSNTSTVRFADNGEICNAETCTSFAQIKCYAQD